MGGGGYFNGNVSVILSGPPFKNGNTIHNGHNGHNSHNGYNGTFESFVWPNKNHIYVFFLTDLFHSTKGT